MTVASIAAQHATAPDTITPLCDHGTHDRLVAAPGMPVLW